MKRGGARKVRVNWCDEGKWEEFADALRYHRIHKNWTNYTGILPPVSTLYDALKRLGSKEIKRENVFPLRVSSLLSSEQVQWLEDVIKTRDLANNGCTRKEVLDIISEITGNGDKRACSNHYDYLIRNGRLQGLKANGRVVTAQAIDTDRSQITVAGQNRFFLMTESEFENQRRVNLPERKFDMLHPYFVWNLDETCLLASAGMLRVVGAKDRAKQNKNTCDSRVSITMLRCGCAAGISGPTIFLAKGKNMTCTTFNNKLTRKYGLPHGSTVIMTPSGYMDDEAWVKVVGILAPAIRVMPVSKCVLSAQYFVIKTNSLFQIF